MGYINKSVHSLSIDQWATEHRRCFFCKLHWMLIYIGKLDVNNENSSTDLGNKNLTKNSIFRY